MKLVVLALLIICLSQGIVAQQNLISDINQNSIELFEAPGEFFIPSEVKNSDQNSNGMAMTVRIQQEDFEIISSNNSITIFKQKNYLSPKALRSTGMIPVFVDRNGARYYFPGGVMVVFRSEISEKFAREILFNNSIFEDSIKSINVNAGLYLVETEGGYEAIKIADKLKDIDEIISAEPQKTNNLLTR